MRFSIILIEAILALCLSIAWAETVRDFYIFLPNSTTWKSSTPMINEDGISRKLEIDTLNCGWYYRRYVDEPIPKSVLIHRDDDPTMQDAIGMNGAWEEGAAEPILLDAMFELYSTEPGYDNALYFVADAEESQKLPTSNQGWYIWRPDVRGYCAFELKSIVYDTDASLHGAFSCTPDWNAAQTVAESRTSACYNPNAKFPIVASATDELPCIGVTTGMVESTIDPKTKKMKLTDKGRKCFGAKADEAFAAMFTATPEVNESSCFNIPLEQNVFGRSSFNSNYNRKTKTSVMGGFYPTEQSFINDKRTDSLPAAKSNRKAEGPAYFCSDPAKGTEGLRTIHPTEKVPVHQLICNGPGWDGGVDCEGFFAAGNEFSTSDGKLTEFGSKISNAFNVTWVGDGWAWSCDYPAAAPEGWPRYTEGTEKEVPSTQNGNTSYRWISGNSDSEILTQGGRNGHFCTESHARFKYKKGLKFNISGSDDIWVYINNKLAVDLGGTHLPAPGNVDLDKFMPDMEIGKQYDVDIYTCNRRSRSSDLSITTNIVPSYEHRDTVWYQNSSCTGFEKIMIDTTHFYNCCHIQTEKIEYLFTTDKSGQDPTKTIISIEDFEANPIQFNGGINIEQPYAPIVNEEALKASLPNGIYYLVIKIGDDQKAIEIRLNDSEGIVKRRVIPIGGANFSIMKTGALEFAIVTDNQSSAKQYAIMDMKGQVVSTGTLKESATRVRVPTAGSFIVKVGKKYKRISMR